MLACQGRRAWSFTASTGRFRRLGWFCATAVRDRKRERGNRTRLLRRTWGRLERGRGGAWQLQLYAAVRRAGAGYLVVYLVGYLIPELTAAGLQCRERLTFRRPSFTGKCFFFLTRFSNGRSGCYGRAIGADGCLSGLPRVTPPKHELDVPGLSYRAPPTTLPTIGRPRLFLWSWLPIVTRQSSATSP